MTGKLRIGIEVQRLFREKKHGMEVVALELIKALQTLDTYNDYFIYVRSDVDDQCIQETANFKIRSLPASSYFTWEQFTLPAAVNKDKLDFLHSTCNTSSLRLSVPMMLTLHDIIYLEATDFKGTAYQNFGNLYRKFVVPRVVKNSKVVITVSQFEREVILKRLNLPEDKIKVIYNAVSPKFNINFSNEILENFRENYKLPDDFILFLGNTAPKKNTINMVKAFVEYRRANPEGLPLVVLDYDARLMDKLLSSFEATDLRDCFIFPGYVPSSEMPMLYNVSTLFLYPSLRESFGLPILEAMACGVPVITSNTSSMPEISADAAVLIDPFDPQDIFKAIDRVLKHKGMMSEMSTKGLKRAEEFTWVEGARQLLSIYQGLMRA